MNIPRPKKSLSARRPILLCLIDENQINSPVVSKRLAASWNQKQEMIIKMKDWFTTTHISYGHMALYDTKEVQVIYAASPSINMAQSSKMAID